MRFADWERRIASAFLWLKRRSEDEGFHREEAVKSAAFSDLRFSAAVAAAPADIPAAAAAADRRVSACTVAAATPAVQICVFSLQQQPAAAFQQPAAARSSVPACSSSAQPAQQQHSLQQQ